MKTLLFIFFCALFAINAAAQNENDTVYVSSRESLDYGNYYHFRKDCPRASEYSDLKAITFNDAKYKYLKCKKCAPTVVSPVKMQRVLGYNLGPDDNRLALASHYFKKSANLQFASIGLSVADGLATGALLQLENDNSEEIAYGVGGLCLIAAAVCEIVSISYTYKGGNALIITPNSIKLTF